MITDQAPTNTPSTRSVTGPAIAVGVLAVLATIYATYVASPWKHSPKQWGWDSSPDFVPLLIVLGIIALGVAVVFGVVARRALAQEPQQTARTGLILAIVGLLTSPFVFWSGLPMILGPAAVLLGVDARSRLGRTPVSAGVAIGLGVLITAVTLFLCVVG